MTENKENKAIKILQRDLQIQLENKALPDGIEAIQIAIQALEKQIPKKPVKSENQVARYVNTYYCPICNLGITGTNIAKWCYHCGQKLDWS